MSVSLRCYSTSLGCPKNRVDTERLLGSLGVALVPVESPDEAELVFINTCAFIQPATEESVRTISGWTTAIWRRGPPCSRASSAFPNPRFRAVS